MRLFRTALIYNPLNWQLYSAISDGNAVEFVRYSCPRDMNFQCEVWTGNTNASTEFDRLKRKAEEAGLNRYGIIHLRDDLNWVVLKSYKSHSLFNPWRLSSYDILAIILNQIGYIRACAAVTKPFLKAY